MATENFQGKSVVATPIKQQGLFGIYHMMANRWKNENRICYFFDLYAGTGLNQLPNGMIDGSPITMLNALAHTASRYNGDPLMKPRIEFNDLEHGSLVSLQTNIQMWQLEHNMEQDPKLVKLPMKSGKLLEIPIQYWPGTAKDTLQALYDFLQKDAWCMAVLLIDPNGPSDLPFDIVAKLFRDFGRRLTIVMHMSANALKRIAQAKAAGQNIKVEAPASLCHMLEMIMPFPKGWIREPVGADQWTIVLLTTHPPKYGWGKQYHLLESEYGQELATRLSMTKKQQQAQYEAMMADVQPDLFVEEPQT